MCSYKDVSMKIKNTRLEIEIEIEIRACLERKNLERKNNGKG